MEGHSKWPFTSPIPYTSLAETFARLRREISSVENRFVNSELTKGVKTEHVCCVERQRLTSVSHDKT